MLTALLMASLLEKIRTRWYSLAMWIGFVLLLVVSLNPAFAGSHPARAKKIDQEVLRIDRELPSFTDTVQENCQADGCVKAISYWDPKGRLRKVVEAIGREGGPGSIKGRYYSDCRLILTRVAPSDQSAVKNSKNIERYYFHKGKLILILFGDETQTFGKEQTSYYEKTHRVEPKNCLQPGASDKNAS